MIVLVSGANGSGKSVCAERLAARLSTGALYYIATMLPFGEEGERRIEKHRRQREQYGFTTVELPKGLSQITLPPKAVVLLEDVSNLLANTIFEGGGDGGDVFDELTLLCRSCRSVVMVTISGLEPLAEHDAGTRDYIAALNRLNDRLFELADAAVTMTEGQPVLTKGEENALF